jgi:hypothetical protein
LIKSLNNGCKYPSLLKNSKEDGLGPRLSFFGCSPLPRPQTTASRRSKPETLM